MRRPKVDIDLSISLNDLYKMTNKELLEVVRESNKNANNMIKQLESTGLSSLSLAYQSLSKKQGRERPSFEEGEKLKSMTKQQLIGSYISSQSYSQLKTATAGGTVAMNKTVLSKLGIDIEEYVKNKTEYRLTKQEQENLGFLTDNVKEMLNEFWKTYEKVKEGGDVIIKGQKSTNPILASFIEEWKQSKSTTDIKEIINNVSNSLNEEYIRKTKEDMINETDVMNISTNDNLGNNNNF